MGSPTLNAQIYSTANHSVNHAIESGNSYSSPSFRSTSSYSTSYQLPSNDFQSNIQFANGQIQTAAAKLNGNILADDGGYIPTKPKRSDDWNDDDDWINDGNGPGVPDTPLAFGWDVVIFMLLLAGSYALSVRRKKVHSTHN